MFLLKGTRYLIDDIANRIYGLKCVGILKVVGLIPYPYMQGLGGRLLHINNKIH